MTHNIRFFVPGIPKPGGSKRGFFIPGKGGRKGHVAITEDCKGNKDWRASVALAGSIACKQPFSGPLDVRYAFYFPRPKGHSRSDGIHLRGPAPRHHVTKPDITKVVRSTEDALKGICWGDDNQVVYQEARKGYTEPMCHPTPGCLIEIRSMANAEEPFHPPAEDLLAAEAEERER